MIGMGTVDKTVLVHLTVLLTFNGWSLGKLTLWLETSAGE